MRLGDAHLIDDGFIFGAVENSLEVLGSEVAHADALELALVFEVFEDLPGRLQGAFLQREWGVDEVEVWDEAEPVERLLDRGGDFVHGNGGAVGSRGHFKDV